MPPNVLKSIPSVSELLESAPLKGLSGRLSRNVVVSEVRTFLDRLRTEIQESAAERHIPTPAELAEKIAEWILAEEQPPLRPVINATGVLLHTGLGRAPLAEEAIEAIALVARGYASVEVDLKTGERSQRVRAVEKHLRQLTGAEAVLVVNNNAAATMLALAAIVASDKSPAGKEVIVSRGQLVEIGGSYRLPDVMTCSGARLKEVGTTNKTRLSDYAAAIGDETAAILRVHTSNYAVVGFTEQPSLAELVALSQERKIPLIDDIGSGALIDLSRYGVTGEPLASESIKAGADLVLFSGDKLLGGPQCGIIAGKKTFVQMAAAHPMARAMRVDKLTLAALAATLRLYRDENVAENAIPLLTLLSTPLENLKLRAERLAAQMAATKNVASAEAVLGEACLGGGSLPGQHIPTWCIALTPKRGSVDSLAARLRAGSPAIFGRVQKDRLLLDLRSVPPRHDLDLVEAIKRLGTASDAANPPDDA
jgi:L-seryl-tRNA(Ser) seleniumtransferase